MKLILAIGIGSFVGGICRYLLSRFVQTRVASVFPFGTLGVNILGCFAIGVVFALGRKGNISQDWQIILATGVVGGFTTFSAFSNDALMLLREGQIGYAISYLVASMVLGPLATLLGYLVLARF